MHPTSAPTERAGRADPIAYVAKVFPRLSETFVLNEIVELERQGVSLRVFSLHSPPTTVPHGRLRALDAPVTCVEDLPGPHEAELRAAAAALRDRLGIRGRSADVLLPRKYVRLATQLAAAARAHGIRHLHAHFASRAAHVAMLASQLLGIPYSFTAHAKDIYHQEVDREALRLKMRVAKLVITVTDFNRRKLVDIGADLPGLEGKLVRSYNGVDLTLFRPGAVAEREPGRILAVGRLVEKKGFPVLVDACAALRRDGVPFVCDIIGSGQQEDALRALVRDAGLEGIVTLRGALPMEAVAVEMRRATLVVLPCVVAADGNVDALPTVLLEAMACGLPVISSALSGIPEIIVEEETGLLVPPGDPGALAAAMRRVLETPGLAERFGRAGRQRAEQVFDLRVNVARLREWLLAVDEPPGVG